MYAQSLVFLRFGCYVHNPDNIFTKASKPIMEWLEQIQLQDNEWGFKVLSDKASARTVISIDVPSTMHHALMEFDTDYIYTNVPVPQVKAIIQAKRNLIRLTKPNLKKFMAITKTTPAELVTVFESYLARIESNPTQPVTKEEIAAIKALGVEWSHAARLPRIDGQDFEPIYIVDDHHRIRCL